MNLTALEISEKLDGTVEGDAKVSIQTLSRSKLDKHLHLFLIQV